MRTLLLVGILALIGALALQPASADAAPVTQVDEQGPDDVTGTNAQRDLNQHTADFANSPTTIDVGWQWDETGFTGSNTGDACALFDTDNDGKVNSAVCVTIAGTPATFQSFSVWTCSDNKVDRCTSPNAQIPGLTTTCTVSPATDPFAAVVSHQTTEGLPDSAIDTAANCTVDLAAVGAGAKLVNTCAYPSASVNSAPDDCVLFLREGLLVIKKIATPNDPSATFNFFLDGGATPVFTAQGSQTSDPIPVRTDITHSLTETAPPGWVQSPAASCSDGSPLTAISVQSEETVTCTFNNIFQSQTPTVTTKIHNGSNHTTDVQSTTIALGSTIHDEATVAGVTGFPTPTGTVDFTFYTSGDCTTGSAASGTDVALVSGVAHPSSSQGPLAAGSYSFKAHYDGDSVYNSADGPCETVTVGKADSTATTEIHKGSDHSTDVQDTTIPLGSSIHDEANVAGVTGIPVGGNVTFTFYANGTCEGTGTSAGSAAVSGGTAHPSDTKGPLAAGSYSFKAHYDGDANYNADDAPCENVTVRKGTSTATTEIHLGSNHTTDVQDTSIPLGSSIHDEANVAGVAGIAVGGTVSFTFYANGTCEGTGTSAGSAAVSGGTAHPSDTKGPLGAGTYSFKASYGGDDNYNSDDAPCEKVTVSKADSTATTEIHLGSNHTTDVQDTSIPLGSSIHDEANVAGVTGIAVGGNVTFTFYANGTCEGTGTSAGSAVVSGGTAHPSTTKGPLGAGTYSFKASYNGDANYNADDAPCEKVTVSKADATATTEVHKGADHTTDVQNTPIPLGSSVHDKANVQGVTGIPVSGNVTFTWYTNGTCEGTGTAAGTVAIVGWSAHPSDTKGPLGAGNYSFKARYNGDSNYNADDAPCEKVIVAKGSASVTTEIHNGSDHVTDVTAVPAGSTVHDKANLGGQATGFPFGGNVTFTFFTNGTCQGTGTGAGTVAVSGGAAHPSNSQGPLATGSYSFRAQYNGDANYTGSTSPCEPLKVYSITTSLTSTTGQSGPKITVAQGGVVSDVATLDGAPSNAGGTVTYKVYSDSACTTLFQNAGTKAVGSNNVAGASDQVIFNQLGTYYWVAVYSGNGSIAGGVSKCGDEVVTVITPSQPRTPGYWKNHEAHTTSLLPIKLGNYTVDTFSKATAVFLSMTCATAHPNSAVGCLAGHLLAGKLNIKNNSAPCIQPVIEKADAFLRGETVTYNGFTAPGVNYTGPAGPYPLTIEQRNLALTMKNAIDRYNNRLGC